MRQKNWRVVTAGISVFAVAAAAAAQGLGAPPQAKATTLSFGGNTYVHRWSRNGHNEHTPPSDPDLDERTRDRKELDDLGQDPVARGVETATAEQMTRSAGCRARDASIIALASTCDRGPWR